MRLPNPIELFMKWRDILKHIFPLNSPPRSLLARVLISRRGKKLSNGGETMRSVSENIIVCCDQKTSTENFDTFSTKLRMIKHKWLFLKFVYAFVAAESERCYSRSNWLDVFFWEASSTRCVYDSAARCLDNFNDNRFPLCCTELEQ